MVLRNSMSKLLEVQRSGFFFLSPGLCRFLFFFAIWPVDSDFDLSDVFFLNLRPLKEKRICHIFLNIRKKLQKSTCFWVMQVTDCRLWKFLLSINVIDQEKNLVLSVFDLPIINQSKSRRNFDRWSFDSNKKMKTIHISIISNQNDPNLCRSLIKLKVHQHTCCWFTHVETKICGKIDQFQFSNQLMNF